nr:MAG TPA: hypothetical protein [Crassvirales sp.]
MNTIMDRNKIVSIATSILISGHLALQDIILLLDSYCIEKGKERKYVDIFIKTITSLPYEIYSKYIKIALKYYMCKYAIHILTKQESFNSIFNRNTEENILLIY